MRKLRSIGEEYVRLSFIFDNILGKGKIVDSFYGKKTMISNLEPLNYKELKYNLIKLKNDVQDNINDTNLNYRKTFLIKQIDALIRQVEIFLGNQKYDYSETIKILLDIELKKPDEEKIFNIQQDLKVLLEKKGYKGSIFDMINEYRQAGEVDFNTYLKESKKISKIFKKKTFEILSDTIINSQEANELYKKSLIKYKIIETDEGWSAYNYYDKNYHGSVVFNSKGNFDLNNLRNFISHEAYPGHHTSGVIREFLHKKGILFEESSIHLLNTPESTIAEGIGDSAIHFLNEIIEDIDLKIEIKLSDLGAEVMYKATIDYHVNHKSDDQILHSLVQNKLMKNKISAGRSLQFIKNWGYYVPTYKYGKEIILNQYQKFGKTIFKSIYSLCNPTILDFYTKSL